MSWRVVNVLGNVQLSHVGKEWATRGKVIDMQTPCWLSQSLPALVDALNQTLSRPKQLQASSMCHVLRGESLRCRHENYVMQAFSCRELEKLNAHIASCMFVTQEPEEWMLDDAR